MSDPLAVSIGNFDGAHLGHLALIQHARAAVGPAGHVRVLAFDPHPATVLRPGRQVPRLSTLSERRDQLCAVGADEVLGLRPRPELLGLSAEAFLEQLVVEHRPQVVVEGPDFRFGRDRVGDVGLLEGHGRRCGYATIVVDPVEVTLADQTVVRVSSTMIRWCLSRGRVRDAATMLGRPYRLTADVVDGNRRGRDLGIPTANLAATDRQLPAEGIYAGRATDPSGRWWPAAISIGTNPTFDDRRRTCETHLIGHQGPVDDYGWSINVDFVDWLRDQVTYDDVDALVAQMQRDLATAAIVGAVPSESGAA